MTLTRPSVILVCHSEDTMKDEPIELKFERMRKGLTQHEAGLLAGLPSYVVSQIETGRVDLPEKTAALKAALQRHTGKKA